MRARENARRAEELAAVVSWLRKRADALDAVAQVLMGHDGSEAVAIRVRSRDKAASLREAAEMLEKGEHHA